MNRTRQIGFLSFTAYATGMIAFMLYAQQEIAQAQSQQQAPQTLTFESSNVLQSNCVLEVTQRPDGRVAYKAKNHGNKLFIGEWPTVPPKASLDQSGMFWDEEAKPEPASHRELPSLEGGSAVDINERLIVRFEYVDKSWQPIAYTYRNPQRPRDHRFLTEDQTCKGLTLKP